MTTSTNGRWCDRWPGVSSASLPADCRRSAAAAGSRCGPRRAVSGVFRVGCDASPVSDSRSDPGADPDEQLGPFEQLLAAMRVGDLCDFSVGKGITTDEMRGWGAERSISTEALKSLITGDEHRGAVV